MLCTLLSLCDDVLILLLLQVAAATGYINDKLCRLLLRGVSSRLYNNIFFDHLNFLIRSGAMVSMLSTLRPVMPDFLSCLRTTPRCVLVVEKESAH